jgi:molybdopterin molybdotransferase
VIRQEEALARIFAALRPLPARSVPLLDAVGCFSAEDRHATLALPSFDNSAMDGYAVASASCREGGTLTVIGEQPAGFDRELHVGPGEAIRIFTGAAMPRGADAVVMQEETEVASDGRIVVKTAVTAGEFVRRRGGDVAAGQKILSAGQRIRAATVALLASQGLASVKVGGCPTVSIRATGDELAPPGAELQHGEIYDSNTPLLQALVRTCGATVGPVEHCSDDEAATIAAVRRGIECDVLIITGGVSVGARDYVKIAIAAAGGAIDLWRVAVKPGKPFLFGRAGDCAIFGLPGNPVSAFVTFLLFVRPALLKLMGAREEEAVLPSVPATLAENLRNDGDRPHYLRGSLRDGVFTPVGRQESHAVYGLSRSDALLLIPPGATINRGETARVFLFD